MVQVWFRLLPPHAWKLPSAHNKRILATMLRWSIDAIWGIQFLCKGRGTTRGSLMFKRSEASEGYCLKCGWNIMQWHCLHMNSSVPKVLRILLVCVPDSGTAQHSLARSHNKVPKKWRKKLNASAWAATSSCSPGAPGVLERDWFALQGWAFLFGQKLPYFPPTHM